MRKELKKGFIPATEEEIKAAEDRLANHPEYYMDDEPVKTESNIVKMRPDIGDFKDKKDPSCLEGTVIGNIWLGDFRQPWLPLVYMDSIMHSNDPELDFAVFTHTWFSNNPEKVVACIMVDSMFLQCGPGIQKFFLLHEIGHFKNNDLEDLIGKDVREVTNISESLVRTIDMELKADAYAFMRCDDNTQDGIIAAFSELAKEILATNPPANSVEAYCVKELLTRVNSMVGLRDRIRSATDQTAIDTETRVG